MRWAAERSGPDPGRWARVMSPSRWGGIRAFFFFFFFSLKHVTVSGIIIVVLKGESYKRDGLLLLEEHIIITIEIKGDR